MYKDGYVHCIKVGYFEEHTGYCYAKGDVKTRTNDRDPEIAFLQDLDYTKQRINW